MEGDDVQRQRRVREQKWWRDHGHAAFADAARSAPSQDRKENGR